MFKCQFTVLGRTEYQQFAEINIRIQHLLPSECNQDDLIKAQRCETVQMSHSQEHEVKNSHFLKQRRTWSNMYQWPNRDGSFLQGKNTIHMITINSSSTGITNGIRLPRTLATAGTSYKESWSSFMLSILYQCSGVKIRRHLAFCRPTCSSHLWAAYPCKTNFVSFYSFCLCILCHFKWFKGALLPQCHTLVFCQQQHGLLLCKLGHTLAGKCNNRILKLASFQRYSALSRCSIWQLWVMTCIIWPVFCAISQVCMTSSSWKHSRILRR